MNWKDKISSICGLVILIAGAIATGIQTGVLTFLPSWTAGVCVLLGVVAAAVVSWAQGKNPNLTSKTTTQVDNLNNEQAATKDPK